MKLFFDEPGYSSCIMPNKNGQLFNDGQRHFVLGSVFVTDKEDEIEILNKYRQFKNRFGEDVTTLAYDMTSFRVQTEVSASSTFFGWVFGFNGKVQILAPESVKEQYRQMIAKVENTADK